MTDDRPGSGFPKIKLLPLFVSGAILFYIVTLVDIDTAVSVIGSLDSAAIAGVSVLLFLNLLVVAYRLSVLLRQFGYSLPFFNVFKANISGLFSSLFIFSLLGLIVGRQLSLQRSGVSLSTVTLLTTYERLLLLLAGGSLFLIGAVLIFSEATVLAAIPQVPVVPMLIALAAAGLGGLAISHRDLNLSGVIGRMRVRWMRQFGELVGITLFGQVISISAYVVLLGPLDLQVSPLILFAAAAVVSFGASLPISINGWGVRELFAILVFGQIGLGASEAVAVSVMVGLCSTAVVLIAAPILFVRNKQSQNGPDIPQPEEAKDAQASQPGRDWDRILYPALPIAAGILLFFQVHVFVFEADLSVNLADSISLLSLMVVAMTLFVEKKSLVRVSPFVWFWLAIGTFSIVLAFSIGAARFGVTSWALNNRLIGWLVLLGYMVAGAMAIGMFGRRGLRKLCQVIVLTAAIVVLVHLLMLLVERYIGLPTMLGGRFFFSDTNFRGFSVNRNALAFQLLMALCCWLGFVCVHRRGKVRWMWAILGGLILYGLWLAQSKAGIALAVVSVLVAVALQPRETVRILTAPALAVGLFLVVRLYAELALLGGSVLPDTNWLARDAAVLNVESITERWESIQDGLTFWFDHPLWGAGLGAYLQHRIDVHGQALIIHSVPVWILAELGIFGFFVFIACPALALWGLRERWRETRRSRGMVFVLILICFGAFGLVHDIAYQRLFWLLLGALAGIPIVTLMLAQSRLNRQRKPISVLHVITSLDRGGAETMLLGLVRRRSSGVRPTVVSLISGGALSRDVTDAGVPLHELGFKSRMPSLSGMLHLVRIIRRERPDVIQGWMYHGDLAAMIALVLSGRWSVTLLAWGLRCSDMNLDRYHWSLKAVVRICAMFSRFPDAVIANSLVGRTAHSDIGYLPRRFDVVHNGIDTDRFHPRSDEKAALRAELGLPQDARVLAHVARVDPMKNHEGLLAAANGVPNLWLLLVGRGSKEIPAQERVIALGQRADIATLLGAVDGVVSSSLFGEGFSNALAEGMATGAVPIATDVGDSRLIVGDSGWVVPPGNTDELAKAMEEFASLSDEALDRMQRRARAHILNNYTLEKAEKTFLDLYETM